MGFMIILGIDHGTKKIGLAISDETEFIAGPLATLRINSPKDALTQIKSVVKECKVEKIVLGLPSGWQNKDSEQTKLVREFAEQLQKNLELKVEFWDETYSSKWAEHNASGRKKRHSDSEAARIILQEYLDYRRGLNT